MRPTRPHAAPRKGGEDEAAPRTGAKSRCHAIPRTGGGATRPRRERGAGNEAMQWTRVRRRGRVAGRERATRPCCGQMRLTRAVPQTGVGDTRPCRERADAAVKEPAARPSGRRRRRERKDEREGRDRLAVKGGLPRCSQRGWHREVAGVAGSALVLLDEAAAETSRRRRGRGPGAADGPLLEGTTRQR